MHPRVLMDLLVFEVGVVQMDSGRLSSLPRTFKANYNVIG